MSSLDADLRLKIGKVDPTGVNVNTWGWVVTLRGLRPDRVTWFRLISLCSVHGRCVVAGVGCIG